MAAQTTWVSPSRNCQETLHQHQYGQKTYQTYQRQTVDQWISRFAYDQTEARSESQKSVAERFTNQNVKLSVETVSL